VSNLLSAAQRQGIIATLMEQGAPADQAEVTIDLALHAMESAVETFSGKIKAAPSLVSGKAAFLIGAQLAEARFNMMTAAALASFGTDKVAAIDLAQCKEAAHG
jgi:hypothetical protein